MDALSTLSPYRTEHINRFGNYVIDLIEAGTVGTASGSFFIASLGVIRQSVCFLPESLPPSSLVLLERRA